jgi:hypothetical protein
MDTLEAAIPVLHTRIGPIELDTGLPATPRDADQLFDASDFQRACQAYLWSLPLVGFAQWQHSARTVFGMRDVDMVVYESLSDRLGLLTANPAVTYIVGLPDLSRTMPLVVDYPSGSSAGAIVDAWQQVLTYLGEGGPDQGLGGRYVVVGPGQTAPNDADFVIQSPTVNVFVGFRALDNDPAHANALVERFSMYPHSQRTANEPTAFLRPQGRAWSQVPPSGLAYWARLADALQRESGAAQDPLMLAMLEPLGINPRRPFAPSTRQRRLLEDAEQVGALIAQAHAFYGRATDATYRPGVRWREVVPPRAGPNGHPHSILDERAAYFYKAAATSAGLLAGSARHEQSCLGVYHDAKGQALDGSRSYHLCVPARPPAKEFWSLAIYDLEQRCLINNGQNVADRSSRNALQVNPDGTVDLFVGPTSPRGRESNWIPTVPGRAWFAYFRLFEPLEQFFAHQFPLPDFEPVSGHY